MRNARRANRARLFRYSVVHSARRPRRSIVSPADPPKKVALTAGPRGEYDGVIPPHAGRRAESLSRPRFRGERAAAPAVRSSVSRPAGRISAGRSYSAERPCAATERDGGDAAPALADNGRVEGVDDDPRSSGQTEASGRLLQPDRRRREYRYRRARGDRREHGGPEAAQRALIQAPPSSTVYLAHARENCELREVQARLAARSIPDQGQEQLWRTAQKLYADERATTRVAASDVLAAFKVVRTGPAVVSSLAATTASSTGRSTLATSAARPGLDPAGVRGRPPARGGCSVAADEPPAGQGPAAARARVALDGLTVTRPRRRARPRRPSARDARRCRN